MPLDVPKDNDPKPEVYPWNPDSRMDLSPIPAELQAVLEQEAALLRARLDALDEANAPVQMVNGELKRGRSGRIYNGVDGREYGC
jgi:hypothetical protein